MEVMFIKRSRPLLVILLLACILFAATEGFAQGRGHGRGQVKKAAKFINGHDARDGRWDGRGPRRRLVRPTWFGSVYRYHGRVRVKHGRKHRIIYRTYRRY
jgi:hypothetical protein